MGEKRAKTLKTHEAKVKFRMKSPDGRMISKSRALSGRRDQIAFSFQPNKSRQTASKIPRETSNVVLILSTHSYWRGTEWRLLDEGVRSRRVESLLWYLVASAAGTSVAGAYPPGLFRKNERQARRIPLK